jgi:hypothetical protein
MGNLCWLGWRYSICLRQMFLKFFVCVCVSLGFFPTIISGELLPEFFILGINPMTTTAGDYDYEG